MGRRLDVDICFGINEAGLVMATFLASSQFGRCKIGCDFEVKHADVIGVIVREVRERYPQAEIYFAVFGAMVEADDLVVRDFDGLTGGRIMDAANFSAVFIAATMAPPGIEPPLELR
jgi:hypothetical protein